MGEHFRKSLLIGSERVEAKHAIFSKMVCIWLARFRHTSSVGGSSVTEQAADAVNPQAPPGPSVVTIFTAAAKRDMPSR